MTGAEHDTVLEISKEDIQNHGAKQAGTEGSTVFGVLVIERQNSMLFK